MFDQIRSWGFDDPSTLRGAILFGILFALFAWLIGSVLRLAVERLLVHDKHDHFDRMAVKFLA